MSSQKVSLGWDKVDWRVKNLAINIDEASHINLITSLPIALKTLNCILDHSNISQSYAGSKVRRVESEELGMDCLNISDIYIKYLILNTEY